MAEQRAAAAEIIAKEANAARLKALLDAAREQEGARTIRSAEARFAAAKTEWESVRRGFRPEPDPYAELDAPEPPVWAAPPTRVWLPRMAGTVRTRGISLGVLAMALLVGGIGAAAYLHAIGGPATKAAHFTHPFEPAPDAPAAPKADSVAKAAPPEPASTAPAAKPIKKSSRPHLSRVPRIRPGQEALAIGAPAPVELPPIVPNVE